MLDNLNEVKHLFNENVYNYANNIIENAKINNYRQMYDELNVHKTTIINIREDLNKYIFDIRIDSKYLDYKLNLNDPGFPSKNTMRTEKSYLLQFTKLKDSVNKENNYKCSYCGAIVFMNNNGICDYCHKPYNTKKDNFLLESIVEI